MTLVQLRYLAAIVDAGLNITAAARQVGATQPGLSKQLKQMEDELGFQLFVRRGKSLERLTPAGAAVVERARVILAEAANIRALAASHRGGLDGELRIATTHTQASFALPRPLAVLKARFPDMRLDLAPVAEREALARVERDEADIAFVSGPERPGAADLAVPIYRWDLTALARRDDVQAIAATPFSLASLAALPLVTYESALQPGSSFSAAFAKAGLQPRIACTAHESDLIKTYVRARMGLGLLAEMAATEQDTDLQSFNIDGLFPSRTTWAVVRRDRLLREPVLELLVAAAPHLQRQDLRRAYEGSGDGQVWPEPPHWRTLATYPAPPLGRFPVDARPERLAG